MQEVKRIGVMSLAKIQAVTTAIFGFIMGLMTALFMASMGAIMEAIPGATAVPFVAGAGLMAIIIFPIIGAIFGFIVGAISALIYNFVAGAIGGIKVELKAEQSA